MRRKGCQEQPFLVSGITSCRLVLLAFPMKRHADDLAVRIALRAHQQAATIARGSAAMSVPHKFLLHADGRPDSVKPRPIGVAERMPAPTFHAKLFRSRTNVVLLNRTRVKAPAGDVARKDPVAKGLSAPGLPVLEHGREVRVQRRFIFRVLGFDPADPSAHRFHLDHHGEAIEMDPAPSQRQDFAHAKPGADGDQNHGAIRIRQRADQCKALIGIEDDGRLRPLADALQMDQIHRVPSDGKQFPEYCFFKEPVHECLDVSLGFGSARETTQPLLHECRPDIR